MRGKSYVTNNLVYGQVPPQASDLEATILGSIMSDPGIYRQVSTILRPDHFYVDAHQKIYTVIQALDLAGQPMDMLSVIQRLKANRELDAIGGPSYITGLTDRVVNTTSAESYAHIVIDKFISREKIRLGAELVKSGYSDPLEPAEGINDAVNSLSSLVSVSSTSLQHVTNLVVDTTKRMIAASQSGSHLVGLDTGYAALNRVTYGLQAPDLIILAARPSVGKTAFALNLARNICKLNNTGVGIFSLEMESIRLMQRLLAIESGVTLEEIITGKDYMGLPLSEYRQSVYYNKGVIPLSRYNLYIDDKGGITLSYARSRAREMVDAGCGVLIFDYLQLMSGEQGNGRGNREQEISTISRGLKQLAKDLRVPVIALSQLSRGVENRNTLEPRLADLRESGAIEQDADTVVFLWREDYQKEEGAMDPGKEGSSFAKVAKHRNGSLDTIPFLFDGKTQRWTEDVIDDAERRIILPPEVGAKLFIQDGAPPGNRLKPIKDLDEIQGDLPF